MNLKPKTYKLKPIQGFTLIEIMVAVSIFVVVALITTGALVTISDVNRKAQAIKIAMDNVSFAMDSMVANLREGSSFGCSNASTGGNYSNNLYTTGCDGAGEITFISQRRGPDTIGTQYIAYRFFEVNVGGSIRGSIQKASTDSLAYVDLTSSEVDIDSLSFYVPSVTTEETPTVTIVVKGEVPGKTTTEFNLQTTVMANF